MNSVHAVILGAGPPYRGNDSASRTGLMKRARCWTGSSRPSLPSTRTRRLSEGIDLKPSPGNIPDCGTFSILAGKSTGSAASCCWPLLPLNGCASRATATSCSAKICLGHAARRKRRLVIAVDSGPRATGRVTAEEKVVCEEGVYQFVYDTQTEAPLFTGLVLFSAAALALLDAMPAEQKETLRTGHQVALCAVLHNNGIPLELVECAGLWASMDDEHTLARFVFGTKAETMRSVCAPACSPV